MLIHNTVRFIWVKRQIEKICHEMTESGVERALTEFPKDMEEMYLQMLQRVRTNKSLRTSTSAENALKLVLYAVRPLNAKEFIEAISCSPTVRTAPQDQFSLKVVLDVCQNLVVLDEQLKVVRFAHFSVQEFLLTQFNSEDGHSCVAEICLTTLLTPYPIRNHTAEVHYMMDYASVNWPAHVRRSGAGSNRLVDLWKEFFSPSSSLLYEKWVSHVLGCEDGIPGWLRSTIVVPLLAACHYGLNVVFGWRARFHVETVDLDVERTSFHRFQRFMGCQARYIIFLVELPRTSISQPLAALMTYRGVAGRRFGAP